MEEKQFLNNTFSQNCGDILKVLKKVGQDKAHRALYECEFVNYPFKVVATKDHILRGNVFNYYKPNEFGFYLGIGKYNSVEHKVIITAWSNLQKRCYQKDNSHYSAYGGKGVKVCEEWKCFQNFASWYEENSKWNVYNYNLDLDKDILSESKIYSPNTCLLIPSEINKFLRGYSVNSGIEERCGNFRCKVQHGSNIFRSLTYSTFEEVRQIYIQKKREFWIDLINEYKMPIELKNKLLNFNFK